MEQPEAGFAALYEDARAREGRMLSDAVVAQLPHSGQLTAYPEEWIVRARSARRLIKALGKGSLRVLEVGCGNGWLSAMIGSHGHHVTAIDVGGVELEQARRVFKDRNVRWVLGDPWSEELSASSFDAILFAASFHYFSDPKALFDRCSELLVPTGEVLVIDSWIYRDDGERAKARERSVAYYHQLGVPGMACRYYHHTRNELQVAAASLGAVLTVQNGPWWRRLGRSPAFPLIRIQKSL